MSAAEFQRVPRFSDVEVEEIVLPGSSDPKLLASFTDPLLSGYSVVLMNDSVAPELLGDGVVDDGDDDDGGSGADGNRLVTVIARFPRCVLSEVNTHRTKSRNSASSRARSMKTTITEVMEDPYVPLFTRNQRGMSGGYLSEEQRQVAVERWLESRDEAVCGVLRLLLAGSAEEGRVDSLTIRETYEDLVDTYHRLYTDEDDTILSPHKQNVNRLLEPFMWHEAIISATEWQNFFDLRDHEEAQPEIRAVAVLIRSVMESSEPSEAWAHTPFVDEAEISDVDVVALQRVLDYRASAGEPVGITDVVDRFEDVFMSSAGDCARVSYKSKMEQGSTDSTKLGKRLLEAGHLSPFEHVAVPLELLATLFGEDSLPDGVGADNFSDSWVQFRTLLRLRDEEQAKRGDSPDIGDE